MAKRKPHLQDARGQILAAGVRVLREEGAEKLTQTRVAKAADVSQGHLTYYFPKKADLWHGVAEHSLELLVGELAEFFEAKNEDWKRTDASTREKVLSVVAFLVQDRPRSRLLLALTLKGGEDPELRKLTLANAERVRQLLVSGMAADSEPIDVDIALSTLWGLAIHHLVYEGERPDGYTEDMIRRFFGLQSPKE